MSSKIFRSSFITSMLVLAISLLMILSVLFNYFEAQMVSELEVEAKYIAHGLKLGGTDYLSDFQSDNKRITLISPDGTVIADTITVASDLENHADRKEVKEAMLNGSGKSERYSDTLTEKTIYYAQKLENGNVLRVCATQNSVFVILLGLMQPLVVIIIAALAISLLLSYRVSSSIIKPINELDLDNPEENNAYDELTPLLKKLTAQKKTINKQIKAAERSREEFRLICENMNEGFLVLDKASKVLSYNSAALKLLEIDEVKDKSVLTFNRTKNFREVIEKALSGTRAESSIKTNESTYDIIANPVHRGDFVIGAVVVIIDVTESAKREQLRREFTSNVSHELKTPLTSISGFAEMMKEGGVPQKLVEDFSTSIYDEAQRMISLVSDIMKISELDEGGTNASLRKTDIYSIAETTVNRLKPIADKKQISIKATGKSAFVSGNAKILDEMVYNLCDNAIKYNKTGGTVEVLVKETAHGAVLTVKDCGIGIPPHEQSRIFERFYRVDKSRSKSEGGTGLGLAIVKHGAIYHGAAISLESTEGIGTSITVTFPPFDKETQ